MGVPGEPLPPSGGVIPPRSGDAGICSGVGGAELEGEAGLSSSGCMVSCAPDHQIPPTSMMSGGSLSFSISLFRLVVSFCTNRCLQRQDLRIVKSLNRLLDALRPVCQFVGRERSVSGNALELRYSLGLFSDTLDR